MIIIGLTGSIAMGKSTAAKIFSSIGVPVFDADFCVHELMGINGKLVPVIAKEFPESLEKIKNNKYINRVKLGNIVFKNNIMKRKLENIIHPQVGKERKKCGNFVCLPLHPFFELGAFVSRSYGHFAFIPLGVCTNGWVLRIKFRDTRSHPNRLSRFAVFQ